MEIIASVVNDKSSIKYLPEFPCLMRNDCGCIEKWFSQNSYATVVPCMEIHDFIGSKRKVDNTDIQSRIIFRGKIALEQE